MHKFGIAQNIVESIRQEIGDSLIKRVNKIYMEIGKLSGVSTESLEFSLQVLLDRKDSRILEVAEIEPIVLCKNCRSEFSPEDMIWICPNCGDMHGELIKGNEIRIINVEVEDEN